MTNRTAGKVKDTQSPEPGKNLAPISVPTAYASAPMVGTIRAAREVRRKDTTIATNAKNSSGDHRKTVDVLMLMPSGTDSATIAASWYFKYIIL